MLLLVGVANTEDWVAVRGGDGRSLLIINLKVQSVLVFKKISLPLLSSFFVNYFFVVN